MKTLNSTFQKVVKYLENTSFYDKIIILNESSDITYYELRKLFTIILNQVKDKTTKKVIQDFLDILTRLEVKNVSIPTLKRSLKKSGKVFKERKN